MPVIVPDKLPAIELLKEEGIFIENQSKTMDNCRPLKLVLLNLMPLKINTETDFVRIFSNTPLEIELTLLVISSHKSKNTSQQHIDHFYTTFDNIKDECYDGLIVTGAPVELLEFEEVKYWEELTTIFDWAQKHVTSSLYICWGAQAALKHFHGIRKKNLSEKAFGIFKHEICKPKHLLFRGFDDEFHIPHSRYTSVYEEDVLTNTALEVLVKSPEVGMSIISSRGGREFYLTGHSEYAPYTLHDEHARDTKKGLGTKAPLNYYKDNNSNNKPVVCWVAHANLLFNNWLNYFVYQNAPNNRADILNTTELNG